MPIKVADPQDTKPRKPPRRPDGLVSPLSAEEEHSTRVRVGQYVTETSAQRFTVLSATPVPPHEDYATGDSEHTTVDDPLQRRRGFDELTSPERTRPGPEANIGNLAPMLPPLDEALGPGAFDEDLFSQDMWPSSADLDDHLSPSAPIDLDTDDLDGDLDAQLNAVLGSDAHERSDTGVDTGLHNIPSPMEEQLETTRHRMETARPELALRPQRAPAPPVRQPSDEIGATSVRRLPLPPQHARPPEPEPPPPPQPSRNIALRREPEPARNVAPRPPEPEQPARSLGLRQEPEPTRNLAPRTPAPAPEPEPTRNLALRPPEPEPARNVAPRPPEPEPQRNLALRAPPPTRQQAPVGPAVDSGPVMVPSVIREVGTETGSEQSGATPRGPLVGGRYHVLERIGAGGMGKVFKVVHGKLGKTFALKIIRDSLAGQDKARDLFYREARMASSLSHPNVASVVDYGEDEKLGAFMVMEFLQGEPLHRMLKREKRLSLRQAIEIIQQVAEALHYIHSKGIVHCDIKTENIILLTEVADAKRRRLQVKLLDFGLARSTTTTRNTNSLAGTPHYVAPERIRGQKASPSSDIYGLGILFYEILTGRVPWDGSVDEILSGHLNLAPTPPSRLLEGGLDPAVEKLILRALAKTPDKRHKDMAAFLYELRTVMDMLGYGRRRGGARRVVVERPASQRDETARALFDACRVPMALLDRAGTIVVANSAFAQFVMGISVNVEGMAVASTPLARVWSTFASDLARACAGTSLRRTVELQLDSGDLCRLLLWLDPGLNGDQAIFGVHPLDG
jgi:serine/threonine-protein kinase